jgi:gas vesicle protein
MNERIRELAEQSGVDAGQLFAEMLCNDSDVNVKIAEAWNAQPDEVRQRICQVIEQNQEKFAELIVRECCQALWTDACHMSDLAVEEFNSNSRKIKRHFGVEE